MEQVEQVGEVEQVGLSVLCRWSGWSTWCRRCLRPCLAVTTSRLVKVAPPSSPLNTRAPWVPHAPNTTLRVTGGGQGALVWTKAVVAGKGEKKGMVECSMREVGRVVLTIIATRTWCKAMKPRKRGWYCVQEKLHASPS